MDNNPNNVNPSLDHRTVRADRKDASMKNTASTTLTQARRSTPRPVRRAAVAAGGLALAGALSTTPAANAATNTFWAVTVCDYGYHAATPDVRVSPLPGYASQIVALGTQSQDVKTGNWSAVSWSYERIYAGQSTQNVGAAPAGVAPAGGKFRIWFTVSWWDDVQRRYVASSGWGQSLYRSSWFGSYTGSADACYT